MEATARFTPLNKRYNLIANSRWIWNEIKEGNICLQGEIPFQDKAKIRFSINPVRWTKYGSLIEIVIQGRQWKPERNDKLNKNKDIISWVEIRICFYSHRLAAWDKFRPSHAVYELFIW
jgi:hypothetical protein